MRFFTLFVSIVLIFGFVEGFSQSREELTAYSTQTETPKSVQLFPNPAIDFLNVKVGDLNANKVKITLHNILGNEMKIETEVVDERELRIRVRDLAPGYYLLAIKEEESKYQGTFKFLKR